MIDSLHTTVGRRLTGVCRLGARMRGYGGGCRYAGLAARATVDGADTHRGSRDRYASHAVCPVRPV